MSASGPSGPLVSKVHQACNNIVNAIKPGSDNNVAKGIRLFDKKAFLFKQEKMHASNSF